MDVVLPKTVNLETVFSKDKYVKNIVVIDGATYRLGNETLLLHQIVRKVDARLEREDSQTLHFSITDSKVKRWVSFLVSAATERRLDSKKLAVAVGYWCDFLVVFGRDGPRKANEGLLEAGFFATASAGAPPFFWSRVSEQAFYKSSPAILEDYVWLAEAKGVKPDIALELVEDFIDENWKAWKKGYHFFLSEKEVRNYLEAYVAAVSARMLKLYRDEWKGALALVAFDVADSKAHPMLKRAFEAVTVLEGLDEEHR